MYVKIDTVCNLNNDILQQILCTDYEAAIYRDKMLENKIHIFQ